MRWVVFLRAANVGGRNAFRPKEVAEALAARQVTSVGAAGTFVVRSAPGAKALHDEFAARVPPACDVLVRPLGEVVDLARRDPFAGERADAAREVSVLAEAPASMPRFPLDAPAEGAWGVRVLRVEGAYALSLRLPGSKEYSNAVVERALGVRATTRGWSTILRIVKEAERGA